MNFRGGQHCFTARLRSCELHPGNLPRSNEFRKMSVACLIGNGFSIAYSRELKIASITAKLIETLSGPDLSGEAASHWISAVTHLMGTPPDKGVFETLLGPIERIPDALAAFDALQKLMPNRSDSSDASRAITDCAKLLRSFYQMGAGLTLSIIDKAAHGSLDNDRQVLIDLINEIFQFSQLRGGASFGTLNYDSLLNGAVIEASNQMAADLADPRESAVMEIGNGTSIQGIWLRKTDDILSARTPIYDLHGSLAWWREPEVDGRVAKFTMPDLRGHEVLEKWKSGDLNWSPAVLMTDQKSRTSQNFPFSLAYQAFEQHLMKSEIWIIVGYSFGDEPVNEMLRRASKLTGGSQGILVIDHESDQTSEWAGRKDSTLPAHTKVFLGGIEGAISDRTLWETMGKG